MANKKITELPLITGISGSTSLPIVTGGTTNQITAENFTEFSRNIIRATANTFTANQTITGNLTVSGNGSIAGNVVVGGRLTAQEYHTELVSSSVIYESGSTKFGDDTGDKHEVTGSLTISGSLLINGIDLTSYSASTAATINNISSSNSQTFNNFFNSQQSVNSLNAVYTASNDARFAIVQAYTASNAGVVSNLQAYTASNDARFGLVQAYTASNAGVVSNLQAYTASNAGVVSNLQAYTASNDIRFALNQAYTASNDARFAIVQAYTASNAGVVSNLQAYTASNAGVVSNLQAYTASNDVRFALNQAYTASNDVRFGLMQGYTSSLNATISVIQGYTASIGGTVSNLQAYTASNDVRFGLVQAYTASNDLKTTDILSYTASNAGVVSNLQAYTASNAGVVSNLQAYTASNDLKTTDILSYTASLKTAVSVSNTDATILGNLTINQNLNVLGSASIQYITSSQLNIADNIISVNTYSPSIRFGGLAVIDSGSNPQQSGSILFDSQENQWIYVHQNIGDITSSILLMGPQTYNSVGSETHPTTNRILKSVNDEHLGDSNITDTGTYVSINSNSQVTGSLNVSSNIVGGANIQANKFVFTDGVVAQNVGGQNMIGTSGNILYLYTGASGLYINNQANNAQNVTITDAGVVTTRGGVQIGSSGNDQNLTFGGTNSSIYWGAGGPARMYYNVGDIKISSAGATDVLTIKNIGGIEVSGGITGSLMATNGVVSSSQQIQNYNTFAVTASNNTHYGENTFTNKVTHTNGYLLLTQVSQSLNFVDDAAAAAGGVPLGGLYRNGNFIVIRIA